MPKFFDTKIHAYVTSPRYKSQSFEDTLEQEHSYRSSDDSWVRAVERSYFPLVWSKDSIDSALLPVFQMDMKLMEVLAKMEQTGVYIDAWELISLGHELTEMTQKLGEELNELAGESFNPLSSKQVQHILYEVLGFATGKKNKTGFSVDSETLEELSKQTPIAEKILQYRIYEKLKSTYCEGLVKQIRPDTKRLHTNYKQTFASTGRLSSENPNLQNIPSGDDIYAKRIKRAFRPETSDRVFVVADYSQVEIRVLAMLSGDVALREAFAHGEDIHKKTARFLFPDAAEITGDMRRIAKSVNFGVIYGITGFWLSKMLKLSPKDCNEYITRFFAQYPSVRSYYDTLLANARETGFVSTYYGRRRYISGLNDANSIMRGAAEREAINMPVQGTAADIIKLAMIAFQEKIEHSYPNTALLMQVHDELVVECPKELAEEIALLLKSTMESILMIDGITLKADVHTGDNWASAKG
jgi:DNA polymerase I